MAELLGVSENAISRWERGERNIRHPRMLYLAVTAIEASLQP